MAQLFTEYLEEATAQGVRQLFFSAGCPVMYRKHRKSGSSLTALESTPRDSQSARIQNEPLTPDEMKALVENAVSDTAAVRRLHETGAVETYLSSPGKMRCLVSVYRQRNTYAMTVTIVSAQSGITVRPLSYWPMDIANSLPNPITGGLCVITGTEPSQRAELAASLVDYYNTRKPYLILTLEDRRAVLHQNKKSVVNQIDRDIRPPSGYENAASAIAQVPDTGADILMVSAFYNEKLFPKLVGLAMSGIYVISVFERSAPELLGRALRSQYPDYELRDCARKLAKRPVMCIDPENGILDSLPILENKKR